MAKDIYQLRPNEGILLKASCVRHGFWGAYTSELVLTNEAILLVEFGMFSNYKGTVRYPLLELKVVNGKPQVIIGSASNGEKQLEVYLKDGSKEDFAFQSDSLRQLKVWEMAISDRFLPNSQDYDAGFYSNLSNSAIGGLGPEDIQEEMLIAKMEGFEKAYNESTTNPVNAEFLGNVAKIC